MDEHLGELLESLPANLGGVYGQVQYAFGEGNGDNKYTGGRIGYAAGPIETAIAYGQTWTNTTSKLKTLDGGVSYDFSVVKLFAQYADLRYDRWKRANYLVGATVPVGLGLIRASYTHSNFDGPACPASLTTCDDANQLAIGYVYFLSKRSALYTTAAIIDNSANGALTVPGGPNGMHRGEKSHGFEAGLRHIF